MNFFMRTLKWISENANELDISLSVIGFAVLLLQARKTRKSAEAAKEATEKAVRAMSETDTISDLATIRERISKVQLALRGTRYEAALIEIQTLRESLYQLKNRRGFASDESKIEIQGMVTFLSKFQDHVERHFEDGSYQVPTRNINHKLAEYATNVSEWIESMRFPVGGQKK